MARYLFVALERCSGRPGRPASRRRPCWPN